MGECGGTAGSLRGRCRRWPYDPSSRHLESQQRTISLPLPRCLHTASFDAGRLIGRSMEGEREGPAVNQRSNRTTIQYMEIFGIETLGRYLTRASCQFCLSAADQSLQCRATLALDIVFAAISCFLLSNTNPVSGFLGEAVCAAPSAPCDLSASCLPPGGRSIRLSSSELTFLVQVLVEDGCKNKTESLHHGLLLPTTSIIAYWRVGFAPTETANPAG